MLILTRRIGETLMIGDDVTVTVLGSKGNQIRIGITAPKDVAVHREEIYQQAQQERAQAASLYVYEITGKTLDDNLQSETIAAATKHAATALFLQLHPYATALETSTLLAPSNPQTLRDLTQHDYQLVMLIADRIRLGDKTPFVLNHTSYALEIAA